MDVMILYALTKGVGSFRGHGCFDFVRTDQKGWDLLDILHVMMFYTLSRGGGIFFDVMDVVTLYALTRGGGIF